MDLRAWLVTNVWSTELDLAQFDFSLRWPRDLFFWESQRILELHPSSSPADMVACLFAEAFVDGHVASLLENDQYKSSESGADEVVRIVKALLNEPSLLHEAQPPRYWLERQSTGNLVVPKTALPIAFSDLIDEFCELDYFPTVMPKPCVDDRSYREVDLSKSIGQAIGIQVDWPFDEASLPLSDDLLYSVVEYFHDHAQRPRTRWLHSFAECGWHYDSHNRESGAAVYRWRVNELLDRYQVGFRLGNSGPEKGRMVRHASSDLDSLADQLVSEGADLGSEKIADSIRLFRSRSSSIHTRRTSIAQLSGYLENRRKQFKARQMMKGDEADLFNIFNNFYVRHDNAKQKRDYGEEYLDWIFWTTLAAIHLLQQLDKREAR